MKVYESHPFALYTIRGNIFFNFMGCTPMYTGFELILGRYYLPQTQKTSFFPLFLVSWAGIIILQPPKAAFCEGGTMAHQNLKRKWGSPCFFLSCRGSNLQNGVKMGFFRTPPTCSCYVFLHHFPSFVILVRLLFQLLYIFHKCNTVI